MLKLAFVLSAQKLAVTASGVVVPALFHRNLKNATDLMMTVTVWLTKSLEDNVMVLILQEQALEFANSARNIA